MRINRLCAATAVAGMLLASTANAALLYDMEGAPPPDGFGPNGFPSPTISQDTIGATEGTNSMKYEVPMNGTFVGALTTVVPAALDNPPGVASILFDMTIDSGDVYAGSFADIGVTIFGFKDATFGLQNQYADFESIAGKAAGTYSDVKIDLAQALNGPGAGKSFDQILADGDLDGITGFQLYISKSSDAPLTVYIDNIRSLVPEPSAALLAAFGVVAAGMARRRRR